MAPHSPDDHQQGDSTRDQSLAVVRQAQEDIARVVRSEEFREVMVDLKSRVEDWQGLQPDTFGDLLLYEPAVRVNHRISPMEHSGKVRNHKFLSKSLDQILTGIFHCWQDHIHRVYLFEKVLVFAKKSYMYSWHSLRLQLLQRVTPKALRRDFQLRLNTWIAFGLRDVTISVDDPRKFALPEAAMLIANEPLPSVFFLRNKGARS